MICCGSPAGSLKLGTVNATELVRTLHGDGPPSTFARAIGEPGRIAKTLFLLAYLSDPAIVAASSFS